MTFRRFPSSAPKIHRTPRYPRYSDEEMLPFFAEIAAGYCYKQSADRCLYPREWVLNTLYSDDEVISHMLNLSMVAGARIRAGDQCPPMDRYDHLYDQYLPLWLSKNTGVAFEGGNIQTLTQQKGTPGGRRIPTT